jgi:hypothetical protein
MEITELTTGQHIIGGILVAIAASPLIFLVFCLSATGLPCFGHTRKERK